MLIAQKKQWTTVDETAREDLRSCDELGLLAGKFWTWLDEEMNPESHFQLK